MKKILTILAISLFFVTPLFAEITEEKVIDQIKILRNGIIEIREATIIYKDGVEIAKTYTDRQILTPDQDLSKTIIAPNITQQDTDKVKAVANAVWTQEVKDAYIKNKVEKEIIK